MSAVFQGLGALGAQWRGSTDNLEKRRGCVQLVYGVQ